jgi:hypothetical protein
MKSPAFVMSLDRIRELIGEYGGYAPDIKLGNVFGTATMAEFIGLLHSARDRYFMCAARHDRSATGDTPQDCNWPTCGCDPYADSVIGALDEAGAFMGKEYELAREAEETAFWKFQAFWHRAQHKTSKLNVDRLDHWKELEADFERIRIEENKGRYVVDPSHEVGS